MTTTSGSAALATRLRPLRWAVLLEGIAPWVPVEKVFMTELGFTPGLVATMAVAYSATVPLLEIPSGILADRWSRRGALMLAGVAALLSVVVGGLSQNVGTYIVSAVLLGVYFALQSGTVDAIVYDTMLEELGSAAGFEKQYGRMQALNSAALTVSALAGGVIAAVGSARITYVVTVPAIGAGLLALSRFREPTLHRGAPAPRLREHLAATWHAVTGRRRVAEIALAMMLGSALTQMLFEFGPLWLVAAAVPTVAFGPYTAAMTSTLGLGGVLAGRIPLTRPGVAVPVTMITTGCGVVLATSGAPVLLIAAQVVLVAALMAVGVHLSGLLHDAVPSSVRSAVSSGIGTLSWLTFLPCSVLFGVFSAGAGIRAAGWIVTSLAAVAGVLLVRIGRAPHHPEPGQPAPATSTESANTDPSHSVAPIAVIPPQCAATM
jgi:MFS family permease